jgi:hypothetical protein
MLKENVQNLINSLEGQDFNLNGFDCKIRKGSLHWDLGNDRSGILNLNTMSENDLSELYNGLIDIKAEIAEK